MLRLIYTGLILGLFTLLLMGCENKGGTKTSTLNIDADIIDKALSGLVSEGGVIGASALIFSGDGEIYYGVAGQADREAARPWQRDTVATIYSMTKPITGVTLMSLYEEGLFDLEDPLAKYLPEYNDVRVFAGVNSDGSLILEAPRRPIKIIDLFRHTSCFGYGVGDDPVSNLMNAAQILDPSKPLSQLSEELAKLPLYCHPGEQWKYSVSVDVQARLAEVLSRRPYEELVQERVLGPLNMSDTRYFVSAAQKPRLAAVYVRSGEGTLVRSPDEDVYSFRSEKPIQINGGHGLVSTLDDYMRFALMLQNEGEFEGVRILKSETVALMSKDHLPRGITERDFLPSKGDMGFGLDFAVRTGPPRDEGEPFGVEGEFFWDGAASTLFWVDPKNDLTVVFLTQVLPFDGASQAKFRRAVYEALNLVP